MKRIIKCFLLCMILIGFNSHINAADINQNANKLNTNPTLRKVITYNKGFVAIGDKGTIKYSSDGYKWSAINITTNNLTDIACSGKNLIAVGNKGTIVKSSDGVHWKLIKPITNTDIIKIYCYKNNFTCFLKDGSKTLSSNNGEQWLIKKQTVFLYTFPDCNHIAYNDKISVGFGKCFYTSNDGIKWTPRAVPKGVVSIVDIVWNGKMFIGVGFGVNHRSSYYERYSIICSKDGIHWQILGRMPGLDHYDCQPMCLGFANNKIIISMDSVNTNNDMPKILFFSSTDGVHWTYSDPEIVQAAPPFVCPLIAYINKRFISTGYYSEGYTSCGGTIAYSSDGTNWKKKNDINFMGIYSICNYGSKVIGVGEKGYIAISLDGGLSWEKV